MPAEHSATTYEHALGALSGLALGDALGMPTQSMSPQRIVATYGELTGLVDASADQPIAPSMPAGSITDDTEQALIVAELLVGGLGHIDPHDFACRLLEWEDDMIARGSQDLLGPSTKLALEQVRAGADINATGTTGTTNGAAMRVCAIGVATPSTNPKLLAERTYESCQVTHKTTQGIQSATLVAAAISAGIDGFEVRAAIDWSLAMVEALKICGSWSPRADVVARTRAALSFINETDDVYFRRNLINQVGTSVEANESIPAAFALAARWEKDPTRALIEAATLGGDTDTIGAIAGAILGAACGASALPADMCQQVSGVSGLDLPAVTKALLNLRRTS